MSKFPLQLSLLFVADILYSSCFTHFTAGQQARMYSYWNSYRAGK